MTYSMKLIDFKTESYETTFGTCELCMSSGTNTIEIFVFEISNGNIIEMENGFWDWGDYFTLTYIENTADFAHWLSQETFEGEPPCDERELQNMIRDIEEDYKNHRTCEKFVNEFGLHAYDIEIIVDFSFDEDYINGSVDDEQAGVDFAEAAYCTPGVSRIDSGEYASYSNCYINRSALQRVKRSGFSGFYFSAQDEESVIEMTRSLFDVAKKYADVPGLSLDEIFLSFMLDGSQKLIEINKEECDKHSGNGDYPAVRVVPYGDDDE